MSKPYTETAISHNIERIVNTLIDLSDVKGELRGADIEKALKDNGVIK